MEEFPNKNNRNRSSQLELLSQNATQMTGGKYRKEASAFLGLSFSVEYCNFITGEQDQSKEDSDEVQEN